MSQLTSKELVRRVFSQKSVPRAPFLPLVSALAAGLEQIPIREMYASPDLLARGMWNAQKLFGYDGVVALCDSTLEAEACGCPLEWAADGPSVVGHLLAEPGTVGGLDIAQLASQGRLPAALEATRRLSLTAGKTTAVGAVVTGPLTLAQHLSGRVVDGLQTGRLDEARDVLDLAGRIMVQLARLYGELKVDLLIVCDPLLGRLDARLVPILQPYFRPTWNVVGFYSAFSVLHTHCHTPELYRALLSLGADGVVAAPSAVETDQDAGLACMGLALPLSMLAGDKDEIHHKVSGVLGSRVIGPTFLTTEAEVPAWVPAEKMHHLLEALRG